MSFEFLKPLNNINISVIENEGLLWECQAGAKSYSEATEKIREEADQLEKELARINEEITDIEPKIKILDSCYDVQTENLALNQQSLINQRLYKKSLIERNNSHEEQINLIIEDYREYIAECKAKLRFSNPTYNLLQTKIIEYEGSKIRSMDLKQKILELKRMEKVRIDINCKLFYEDIIEFAQNMVNKRSHLQAMSRLKTVESKERECMQKMREAMELLKQKQMWKFPQSIRINFSRPLEEMKFPANDVQKSIAPKSAEKGRIQANNSLASLKKMLETKNTDSVSNSKENIHHYQKPEFNTDKAKVRILENKTLNKAPEKIFNNKSKEQSNREIAAKIQKAVQKFNISISRQNSKKSIVLSQKSSQVDNRVQNAPHEKLSQQSTSSVYQENMRMEVQKNPQRNTYKGTDTTQAVVNLVLDNGNEKAMDKDNFINQSSNGQNTSPNQQVSYFTENKYLNRNNLPPSLQLSKIGNPNKPTHNTKSILKNSQTLNENKDVNPMKMDQFKFSTTGFNTSFGIGNINHTTFLQSSGNNDKNVFLPDPLNFSLGEYATVFSPSTTLPRAENEDEVGVNIPFTFENSAFQQFTFN